MRHEGESRQCACGAVHRADDAGQCLGCGRKAPAKFDIGLIVGVAVAIALVGLIVWGVSTSSGSSGGVSKASDYDIIQREAAKADAWIDFERADPAGARKVLDSLRQP